MPQVTPETQPSVERDLLSLVRQGLLTRTAYAAASPDRTAIRLHANENPWSLEQQGDGNDEHEGESVDTTARELNRYPSPHPQPLVVAMARYYQVPESSVMPVRGSDDGIDLLIRVFCRAGEDSITISSPAFGMYRSSAEIQGAGVIDVPLAEDDGQFFLDCDALVQAGERENAQSKLVFICTPNNPSGNSVSLADIEAICQSLQGRSIVVVDEAYIEFSELPSASSLLEKYSNLVVLRTLSKAFGAAGLRCGAVLGHPALVQVLRSVATPYALSTPVVDLALSAFESSAMARLAERCDFLVNARQELVQALEKHPQVKHIYPSDANFLLVRFDDTQKVLSAFQNANVLVRDFSKSAGSEGCLRISIGTARENKAVLAVLDQLPQKQTG